MVGLGQKGRKQFLLFYFREPPEINIKNQYQKSISNLKQGILNLKLKT
jgi:hypothetical protein